jgi:energy-coupling factor transporter ATP-binding protein EcfA2
MLRRLDLTANWRSLGEGFWPDGFPAGGRTVIYGHNGSGKSTLAELLLSVAEGAAATSIVWEDENEQRTAIATGGPGPARLMAVFTKKWVEENLSAFLDGDGEGASAIVTLGRDAIDAKEEEERLIDEVQTLAEGAREAEKQQKAVNGKVDKLIRGVQDRIVAELRTFDYDHFTKNRYSFTKVQAALRTYKGDWPDADAHAEALKHLGEGAPTHVPEITTAETHLAGRLPGLSALLGETPTRVAIEALEDDQAAQAWAERGIDLHKQSAHCLFCAGELTEQRRQQLALHFDESWLRIRARAKDMLTAVTRERETWAAWDASLPAPGLLTSEFQSVYADALTQARADLGERLAVLDEIETALDAKATDPSSTPREPDWSRLTTSLSTTVLAQATSEHNAQARRHEELTSERKQIVLDHLIGSQCATFRELEEQTSESARQCETNRQAAALASRRLDEVRQSQFTTRDMAETLMTVAMESSP